ncbi:hypothetical protein BLOT_015928 [Blomia tropicalis]|nr:hypothetical protein BLOT_015928 [Blomia tropicalis]
MHILQHINKCINHCSEANIRFIISFPFSGSYLKNLCVIFCFFSNDYGGKRTENVNDNFLYVCVRTKSSLKAAEAGPTFTVMYKV